MEPEEKSVTPPQAPAAIGHLWFERQGVRIERVMTDDGTCSRSTMFRRAVKEFGARHLVIGSYTPQTHG